MKETIIKNAIIVTMDRERNIIQGNILIRDNIITDIFTNNQHFPKLTDRHSNNNKTNTDIIDANENFVLPGLINVHTHADCTLIRGGISQDRNLYDWLVNLTDPARTSYTRDILINALQLFWIEAIRNGITTFVDNAGYIDPELHSSAIEFYLETGMRVRYAPMFMDKLPKGNQDEIRNSKESSKKPPPIQKTEEALFWVEEYLKKYNNTNNDLLKIWVSPRLARGTTETALRESVILAKKYNTIATTHCAETKIESKGNKISTVQYLKESGFLSPYSVLAHCVWISDEDIRNISTSGAKVAHLPKTNLFLGSGIAPISKLLSMDVCVGIGSDNPNANNQIDILSEMQYAALLQKGVNEDPRAITAEEVLEMGTIQAAKLMNEESIIGSIEIGKKADIIIINKRNTNMIPSHHIPGTIIYQGRGNDVVTTIINGEILLHDGKLTKISKKQENQIYQDAQKSSLDLMGKAMIDTTRITKWNSRFK